ncbi:MAG: hypothetical protein JXA11_11685 [Phycisphaerae bacterium]|nr:hypothetical protein [Phycisphaerae bacterium]
MNLIESVHRNINYLTRSVDQNRAGIPYFMTFWHENGMEYRHNPWDVVEMVGRFTLGMALNRYITGMDQPFDIEGNWFAHLQTVWNEEFGLYAAPQGWRFIQTDPAAADYCGSLSSCEDDIAMYWDNRPVYLGLALRGLLMGDSEALEWSRKTIEGFKRWAVQDRQRQWAYYTTSSVRGRELPDQSAPPFPGQNMGGILTLLVKDYEWFDDEDSLELAVGLANCSMDMIRLHDPWPKGYNTHSYFHYLAGLGRLYEQTADRRYLDYAKEHFDDYLPRFSSSFGWVAEWPDVDIMSNTPASRQKGNVPLAEGCSTVDAVDAAIILARCGYDEYWAVAERFARNYMLRSQVSDIQNLPKGVIAEENEHSSFLDIPDRLLGTMAGWGAPDDIVDFEGRNGRRVFQSCCGSHFPYGVFQVWDHTAMMENGTVSIHFAFDRETPFVHTVHTTNSDTGQFTIKMKQDAALRVRIPEFVNVETLLASVDGKPIPCSRDGRYADFGSQKKGIPVQLTYPMNKRTTTEHIPIWGKECQIDWLGTDVVGITPKGTRLPIFNGIPFAPSNTGAIRDVLKL